MEGWEGCIVADCERQRRYSSGMCAVHYMRVHNHGNTDHLRDVAVRLRLYISQGSADECWLWTGGTYSSGYGRISIDNRQRAAHRVVYEREVGPIPEGLVIDHECHNRAAREGLCAGGVCEHRRCCNPSHLRAVTLRQNKEAGLRNQYTARTHCMHGHEYTPENTRVAAPKGRRPRRYCKTCATERRRTRRSRKETRA